MRLVDGAETISGDLPSSTTARVEVPLEAGDALGSSVLRLSSLTTVAERVREHVTRATDPVIVIGGDCGIEAGAIAPVIAPDVAVVWFDAHPDLNTPESSPSGAFGGMVLRTLLGDGPANLVPAAPLSPERVILAGARAFDAHEEEYLDQTAMAVLGPEQVTAARLLEAVEATGASRVYVHIDLDVLDPAEFESLTAPQPFGVPTRELVAGIRALTERFELAGAGITAFAPANAMDAADDMPTVLRLIAALTSRRST